MEHSNDITVHAYGFPYTLGPCNTDCPRVCHYHRSADGFAYCAHRCSCADTATHADSNVERDARPVPDAAPGPLHDPVHLQPAGAGVREPGMDADARAGAGPRRDG